MTSELEISMKKVIRRIRELNQYKDSGSVKLFEIEHLQEIGEKLRKQLAKILRQYKDQGNGKHSSKKEKERFNSLIESTKTEIETLNSSLDVYEDRFRKYNVPKRVETTSDKPLKPYLERLEEYMKITWRKEAEKNRDKKQRSLIEWMGTLDQSNEEEKIAFDALKTCFSQLGIQISKFLIEYFFLLLEVSDNSEIVLALSLYEVKAVLKCLTVEENSKSIAINTFTSMVEYFEEGMKMAAPCWNDKKEWDIKEDNDMEKVMFFLGEEGEDDLLYLIIIEVLRLEVSFCSPNLPMKVTNDVFYSMAKHLVDNVFEEKLNRLGAMIDGLKRDMHFAQDDSSEMKFFMEALEAGVKELWTQLDFGP